jgi:hypothetical protein
MEHEEEKRRRFEKGSDERPSFSSSSLRVHPPPAAEGWIRETFLPLRLLALCGDLPSHAK